MYSLDQFSLSDMTRCSAAIRKLGDGAEGEKQAAAKIVGYLFDHLRCGEPPQKACALIRLFKTVSFARLSEEQGESVRLLFPDLPVSPDLTCLTLLATAGTQAEWNDVRKSKGHQVIPLPSREAIERLPMISELISQMGLDVSLIVESNRSIISDIHQHTFNVFHVPEAAGSPYVPAQEEFVEPFGIKSVVGFGSLLPNGEMLVVVLFTRSYVSLEVARLFTPLALALKLMFLPFSAAK